VQVNQGVGGPTVPVDLNFITLLLLDLVNEPLLDVVERLLGRYWVKPSASNNTLAYLCHFGMQVDSRNPRERLSEQFAETVLVEAVVPEWHVH